MYGIGADGVERGRAGGAERGQHALAFGQVAAPGDADDRHLRALQFRREWLVRGCRREHVQ